ncbi:DUF6712 family protein [Cochleicola gelatinilyticus]|uniref:Uncharacterized protein n=1 Tax=Cochleicola gelatinilyticus TaxID=1763537 RepID=A0A167HMS1_9FLAO|nr:hypothetical protein [Cochleicola gelatinilyticus]OAB78779.1 hypothetical protein ULVI_09360 [Cochleicola gelatinilyticus]
MNQLITAEEFASNRDIGGLNNRNGKLDSNKIYECIKLAQSIDLYDILGDFLFEVIENKDEETYKDLLSGSTFITEGKVYFQEGIKSILSDLTYSRYVVSANVNFTSFGAVTKLTDNSQPVDRNLLRDIQKQTAIDTRIKFKFVDKYLRANRNLFPNYVTGNNPDINTGNVRFTLVR